MSAQLVVAGVLGFVMALAIGPSTLYRVTHPRSLLSIAAARPSSTAYLLLARVWLIWPLAAATSLPTVYGMSSGHPQLARWGGCVTATLCALFPGLLFAGWPKALVPTAARSPVAVYDLLLTHRLDGLRRAQAFITGEYLLALAMFANAVTLYSVSDLAQLIVPLASIMPLAAIDPAWSRRYPGLRLLDELEITRSRSDDRP